MVISRRVQLMCFDHTRARELLQRHNKRITLFNWATISYNALHLIRPHLLVDYTFSSLQKLITTNEPGGVLSP